MFAHLKQKFFIGFSIFLALYAHPHNILPLLSYMRGNPAKCQVCYIYSQSHLISWNRMSIRECFSFSHQLQVFHLFESVVKLVPVRGLVNQDKLTSGRIAHCLCQPVCQLATTASKFNKCVSILKQSCLVKLTQQTGVLDQMLQDTGTIFWL